MTAPCDAPGLLTPSLAYRPFRYPWAYEFWKWQQQVHRLPEDVPLGEHGQDWTANLNAGERNLTQIFRFFSQSDIEVRDNDVERYGRVFKPTGLAPLRARSIRLTRTGGKAKRSGLQGETCD